MQRANISQDSLWGKKLKTRGNPLGEVSPTVLMTMVCPDSPAGWLTCWRIWRTRSSGSLDFSTGSWTPLSEPSPGAVWAQAPWRVTWGRPNPQTQLSSSCVSVPSWMSILVRPGDDAAPAPCDGSPMKGSREFRPSQPFPNSWSTESPAK